MGAAGIAAAYLTTRGNGSGGGYVAPATPVSFTVRAPKTGFVIGTSTKVTFTYSNSNTFMVKLATPAHITAVKQNSAATTCWAGTSTGTTLIGTAVTVIPATTAIGTVGGGASTVVPTTAKEPSLTVQTATVTQKACTFIITIHAA